MNVFDLPPIARVRRNHALEHATIHVLTEKKQSLRIVGRSTMNGFFLYGNLPTDLVREAVQEAYDRLRAGEHQLAIHPHCGTNLVASGSMAGLATFAVLGLGTGQKRRLNLLPSALLAATVALILAQPLGPQLQAHFTTMADLGDLTIQGVRREERGGLLVHYVTTG
jgi:hypothetical protein